MLDLLSDIALIFSFVLAPSFYMWSVIKQRSYTGLIMHWRMTGTAVLTLVAFSVNLALFIMTAIFFSGILGSRSYPEVFTFSPDTMRRLAMISGSFMVGMTLTYLGIHKMMRQLITHSGIWYIKVEGMFPFPQRKLLPWSVVRDYYTIEDYPVTQYYLILNKTPGLPSKMRIRVPFHSNDRFKSILNERLAISDDLSGDEIWFQIPDFRDK